ncbi:MAG: glycyl-radical enzyme activating protein, partial [Anaerolineaceae bacterium]|nr:glycyl-radical enzyme activating protein [Anaerolineaceae bacterium]
QVQVQRIETNCIGCRLCVEVCPQGCLSIVDNEIIINHELCDTCAQCVQKCPSGAWELLGKKISVEELTAELLKDRSYYQTSDGGVTFSGGEPMLQADFVAAVMANLQAAGVHTALDTCGMVSQSQFVKVLPYTDLVLFDLKLMDPHAHQDHTGQHNEPILRNLIFVRDYLRAAGGSKKLWIRTPLIPEATDMPLNLFAIGSFLASELDGTVERWELCAFNNLCRDKYRRLGLEWQYDQTQLFTQSQLDERYMWAQASPFSHEKIIVTGASRVQTEVGG